MSAICLILLGLGFEALLSLAKISAGSVPNNRNGGKSRRYGNFVSATRQILPARGVFARQNLPTGQRLPGTFCRRLAAVSPLSWPAQAGATAIVNFDIKAAVHFVAVAEEASFTRAAAKLGLAQPWLSQRIRLLEAQLGFALFTRTTRRVELTEKGQAFLAAARPLAQAAAALAQAARSLSQADQARLRIGAPPYSARIPVRTRLVSDFMARHGDISLELEIGWTPLLLERVLSGALDGAFGIGWLPSEGLRQVPICTLAVEFLLAADDPLAGTGPLPAAALAGRRVAVFTRGLYPQLFDLAFEPLARAGAQLVQIVEFNEEPAADQRETPPLIVTDFGLGRSTLAKSIKRTRRPLRESPPVPFSFFTRAEGAGAPAERFWRLAQQYAQARGPGP